ncbi:MAG: hypothetical protein V7636_253 [Actinomycetota bacterium]|jgi:branched-chain amino acid transport system ATP-binding protein
MSTPALEVRGLEVRYDGVQVVFGVDLDVAAGETIALLGTNGAGKSTILRAIAGITRPAAGTVCLAGQHIAGMAAHEIAAKGLVQAPGGAGVFPSLTVRENLRIASWLQRRRRAEVAAAQARVLDTFPELSSRLDEPAGNLSGGQQQMVTLGMALLSEPALLMIDELSLGLAPAIVERLLEVVRAIRSTGTAILVVEQSVNVALTIADRAYFLEKGEVRFTGPTSELLDRPDVLRSVFLHGATDPPTSVALPVRTGSTDPAIPSAPALTLRSVSRSFGGIRAVDDLSFDVASGEIVGVIGPNGAGKTTVFDLISGFLSCDNGHVELHGHDVTELGPDRRARRGLGRSFQDARLFPGLTVRDAIAVALDQHLAVRDPIATALKVSGATASERAARETVDELIVLLNLDAFADKFIAELSTGSRRMVDLACILAQRPSVVLFDEPSSGIAQREAEALAPVLQSVRDRTGAALVVIEHDMPLITSISDRLLALELGRLTAEGQPAEVLSHPAVVASYLGTDGAAIERSGVRRRSRSTSKEVVLR